MPRCYSMPRGRQTPAEEVQESAFPRGRYRGYNSISLKSNGIAGVSLAYQLLPFLLIVGPGFPGPSAAVTEEFHQEAYLKLPSVIPRMLLAVLGLLVATLLVQPVRADTVAVDFSCNLATCSGTVTNPSAGDFSGTGISVTESSGSGFTASTDTFTLAFDTLSGMISITDNGPGAEDFSGTITSFVPSNGSTTGNLTLYADWTTIPSDVQAYFNTLTGTDSGAVTFVLSSGDATSVDVTITPAPEPGVLLLSCAGLLGLGLMLKRRAAVLA